MFYKCKHGLIINLHLIDHIDTKQNGKNHGRDSETVYTISINDKTYSVYKSDYEKIQKLVMEIK